MDALLRGPLLGLFAAAVNAVGTAVAIKQISHTFEEKVHDLKTQNTNLKKQLDESPHITDKIEQKIRDEVEKFKVTADAHSRPEHGEAAEKSLKQDIVKLREEVQTKINEDLAQSVSESVSGMEARIRQLTENMDITFKKEKEAAIESWKKAEAKNAGDLDRHKADLTKLQAENLDKIKSENEKILAEIDDEYNLKLDDIENKIDKKLKSLTEAKTKELETKYHDSIPKEDIQRMIEEAVNTQKSVLERVAAETYTKKLDEMKKQIQTYMQQLQSQHESRIGQLVSQLNETHNRELGQKMEGLHGMYQANQQSIQAIIQEAINKQQEEVKAIQEKTLAENEMLNRKFEELNQGIEAFKQEMESKVDSMNSQYDDKLKDLERESEVQKNIQSSSTLEIQNLKPKLDDFEHQIEHINKMTMELYQSQGSQENKIQEASSAFSGLQQELASLKGAYQGIMQAGQTHDRELARMDAKVNAIENKLSKTSQSLSSARNRRSTRSSIRKSMDDT